MLEKKNSYIYSFEGKDVYNKILEVKEGKKRKATFDYSLDAIKMEQLAKDILNKRRYEKLFFQDEEGKQYTDAIINMTFKYNAYEYNMLTYKKETYYIYYECKLDTSNIKNMEFTNGMVINPENKNIEVIKLGDICNTPKKLPKGFGIDEDKKIKLKKTGLKIIDDSSSIRNKLYNKGFSLKFITNKKTKSYEIIEYVRYKRSSGASRVGKCLFIRKELYNAMMEWSMMGLDFKNNDAIDLAGLQAYISLTTSSIIDTFQLKPENILLIDDYKSEFNDNAMVTKIIKENYIEDGQYLERDRLQTKLNNIEVCNNIWDGQSLLDESIFEAYGYSDKGFILGRNQFFKSACFNCGIQRFFEDNDIISIEQLNGKTIAKNIEDIKLITTPSSIKYLKYGSFEDWLKKLDTSFGIVKYDKPTHYFKGEMVQTHYQLINTLPFTKEDMDEFLQQSLDYIRLLKTDIRVFREHLHLKMDKDIEYGDMNSTDEFIMTMLRLNSKFENTDLFVKFRQETVQAYIKNIKKGHVLVHGNYSVLCGNGIEMLKSSCGSFKEGDSVLKGNEIVCSNFEWDKCLLGSRSPHVTMGNVLLAKNASKEKADEIMKYFNSSKQIVHVNSIKENILERLSGCDFDSDTMLLTDNEILIRLAKKYYNNFHVPTSDVSAKKIPRENTYDELCDLDIKTSENLIGEIINCSQILNSILWDLIYKGKNVEDKEIQNLYADISQLDVMSCIEIDKAKKEFSIDNKLELDTLRNKYIKKQKKPMFFKFLSKEKGNEVKSEKYREYNTSMDYLIKTINRETKQMKRLVIRNENNPIVTFGELFSKQYKIDLTGTNHIKTNKIINGYNILRSNINSVWSNNIKLNEDKFNETKILKEDFMIFLKLCNLDCRDIKKIIIRINKEMNNKEVSNTYRTLLSNIYIVFKEEFIKVFEDTKEKCEYLKQIKYNKNNGNYIKLYDSLYEIVEN